MFTFLYDYRRQLPPTPLSESEDDVDGAPDVPERTCSRQSSIEQPDDPVPVVPRRIPDFHDVPYDTPPPSGQPSAALIENTEPIYENTDGMLSFWFYGIIYHDINVNSLIPFVDTSHVFCTGISNKKF